MATNGDNSNLYHVLFLSSQSPKDVNAQVEKLRVCGTYTSLKAAKGAAHRALFEAGYEKEWFTEYDTNQDDFETHHIKHKSGLAVLAKAQDGTTFRVSISTTPNNLGLWSSDDHKIHQPLYHVVQTTVLYNEDDSGVARETNVEGSFLSYEEARKLAGRTLLSPEDGITKENFESYEEAGPKENDCGYGDNVIVHAVGKNGENFLVSVLRGQELESVRLAEAAMRIRA
jgi:hypothetical protein